MVSYTYLYTKIKLINSIRRVRSTGGTVYTCVDNLKPLEINSLYEFSRKKYSRANLTKQVKPLSVFFYLLTFGYYKLDYYHYLVIYQKKGNKKWTKLKNLCIT